MTNIDLTDQEAIKFRVFMENYTFFNALIEAGVHKGEKPQYVLYFNKFGVLKNIETKYPVYTQGSA